MSFESRRLAGSSFLAYLAGSGAVEPEYSQRRFGDSGVLGANFVHVGTKLTQRDDSLVKLTQLEWANAPNHIEFVGVAPTPRVDG